MKQYGLTEQQHIEIAKALYDAEKNATPIIQLTETYPAITQEDAYAIQQEGLRLRMMDGEKIIGRKIGITSRGVMKMLNCDTPDYGYLLASAEIPEGTPCKCSELASPLVEGELAFIMGEDLDLEVVSTADVINATAWVVPCYEICDTHYPSLRITVRDTISDNAGAGRFVLGSCPKRLSEINPRCIGMVLEKNGTLLGSAAGVEVMGSPVNSVTWLANKLLEYGTFLKKGDIILSGAFMTMDQAQAGDVYSMSVDGFPTLTLRFE